jgi:hypothetical protein
MEYGAIIWDPHISKLEIVQRRSVRFVIGGYKTTSSVSVMMNEVHWQTLQERRAQPTAVMMFRIVNNLVDIPTTHLISSEDTVRNFGALCQDLHIPEVLLPRRDQDL